MGIQYVLRDCIHGMIAKEKGLLLKSVFILRTTSFAKEVNFKWYRVARNSVATG